MSKTSDEEIVAYVDGQLDDAACAAFEARLAQEPELARQVAAHRWMARQISAAFGAPSEDRINEADLARLGLFAGDVVRLPARRLPSAHRSTFAAVLTGAIAASLVVGVAIDRMLLKPDRQLLETTRASQLVAQGELADSLSNQLSGAPGAIRIGISFRTAHAVCRTFSTSNGLSGLGCRRGTQWVVPTLASEPTDPQNAAEYRLAGGEVAPSVMAEVDRRMVGDPISPAAEKTLMANHWQTGG